MPTRYARIAVAFCALLLPITSHASFQIMKHAYPDGRPAPSEIYFSGEIAQSTPKQFLDLVLSTRTSHATVYFDSIGGDLLAGIELGEHIRKAGFNTAIGKAGASYGRAGIGKCQSSCVLSYAAGYYRFAEHGSSIGIHRFYRKSSGVQDLDVGQLLSAAVTSYLIRMGTDPALFEKMAQVGRGRMHTLHPAEAVQLNLTNNGILPVEWSIVGKSGQVYLRGQQETWNGTGKLLFSCENNNRVKLTALYDAGANTSKIAYESVSYSLRLDSRFIPVEPPVLRDRPNVQGDYIMATMILTPALTSSIRNAFMIGFAFHPRDSGQFFGFSISARQDQDTIHSFIAHCQEK